MDLIILKLYMVKKQAKAVTNKNLAPKNDEVTKAADATKDDEDKKKKPEIVGPPLVTLCCEHCSSPIFKGMLHFQGELCRIPYQSLVPIGKSVSEKNKTGQRPVCPHCDNVTRLCLKA